MIERKPSRAYELAMENVRLRREGKLDYWDCANCYHPPHGDYCDIERLLNRTTTPRRERATIEDCGCNQFAARLVTYETRRD